MKNITTLCTWAVAYKIDRKNYDDGKTKISITAVFCDPINAEDFINNCLPEETKDRFFIIGLNELEKCEDCDKVQKVTDLYAKIIN